MDERIGFGLYQSFGNRGSVGRVSVFWLLFYSYFQNKSILILIYIYMCVGVCVCVLIRGIIIELFSSILNTLDTYNKT